MAAAGAPPDAVLEATILLRRRADPETEERLARILRGEAEPLSREEAADSLGADPVELHRAMEFAASAGLTIVESSLAKRSVRVSGTVAQMQAAFGVTLRSAAGGAFFYEGALTIPAALEGIVTAVLGLDQRPVARR